jgi:transposase
VIRIAFNEGDKAALNDERYNHPHPFVQQKMEVLGLKSQGMKHKDICRMADVCSTTLTSHVKEYAEGGIEALKTVKFNRPRSELDDHRETLAEYFQTHPPATVKEAMAAIEKLTGLKRSHERTRRERIKGYVAFVHKPFQLADVLRLVATVLASGPSGRVDTG